MVLATARVTLIGTGGKKVETRGLIDPGSEVTLLSASLAQRLRIPLQRVELGIRGVGGLRMEVARRMGQLKISTEREIIETQAYILPHLGIEHPRTHVGERWDHLLGLQLADPNFSSPGPIHLLLGADVYGSILREGIRKGPSQAPIVQQTVFGWIVIGPTMGREFPARLHLSERYSPPHCHPKKSVTVS